MVFQRSARKFQRGHLASDADNMFDSTIALLDGFSSLERFELGFSPKSFGRVIHTSGRTDSNMIYDGKAWASGCVTLKEIWLFGTKVV